MTGRAVAALGGAHHGPWGAAGCSVPAMLFCWLVSDLSDIERPERPFPNSLQERVTSAAGAARAHARAWATSSGEDGEKFTKLVAQVAQVALLPLLQGFLNVGRSPNFRGGRSGRSLALRAPSGRGRSPGGSELRMRCGPVTGLTNK